MAELSRHQNCVTLLREARPIKQNQAKLSRLKRSLSSNEKSEAASNGGATTLASDSNKKFEKIFNNNQVTGDSRAAKYKSQKSQEDTSEMGTEDKSEFNALSNNKSDKWGDDSDQDDDSQSYSQNIRNKANVRNKNDYYHFSFDFSNEYGEV